MSSAMSPSEFNRAMCGAIVSLDDSSATAGSSPFVSGGEALAQVVLQPYDPVWPGMFASLGLLEADALPRAEFAFPGPLRDKLVAAILDGTKTTTSGLYAEYESAGEVLPTLGDLSVLVDSKERPVGVLRDIAVRTCRLADVPLDHAIGEGEGFETIAQWRAAHESFWESHELRRELNRPDFQLNDDTQIVCERFELVERL